jgi:hypothetical protein
MNDEKKKRRNVYIYKLYVYRRRQTDKQIGYNNLNQIITWGKKKKRYWTKFGVEDFRVNESTDVVDVVADTLFAKNKKYNIEKENSENNGMMEIDRKEKCRKG